MPYFCDYFTVLLPFDIDNLQVLADFFLSVGLGLGGADAPQIRLRKSISNERTFPATDNEALLYQKLGWVLSSPIYFQYLLLSI